MLTSELFSFKNPKFFNYHQNFKYFTIIIAFFFFFPTIFLSGIAHSVERKLVFDPSPDERVIGYYLYWGESENFEKKRLVLEGRKTTDYLFKGLTEGQTYYFAASAYDEGYNESVLSDVLVYTVDVCTVHYSLNLGVDLPGSGTINKEPDLEFYSSDSEVSLTATAATGYEFSHWSGDLVGAENPVIIVMNGDREITANFSKIPQYTLDVTVEGTGGVTVDPDRQVYDLEEQVTLTANADTGWMFTGWSGDLEGAENPVIIVMNGDREITANFSEIPQYTLDVTVEGTGGVTVDPDRQVYALEEQVTLTADAGPGWMFTGWSGDLEGSENPATVIMNSSKSVIAHFLATFMQVGEADFNGNPYDKENWIPFEQPFIDPVVVAKPASLNDPDPAVVRIEVGENANGEKGFYIWIQNWEYLNRIHDYETVSYLVIEKGSYVLPGGIMLEAGTFEADGSNFTLNPFVGEFNYVPVVIASVTSINDTNAVTGRIRNVTSGGFEYLLQQQDRNSRGPRARSHGTEKVSFIACEPFSGNLDGITIEVDTTGNQVSDDFYHLFYKETFERAPYFLADMQTANDMDTANVRYRKKTLSGVKIHISEERSQNASVKHENENVGYFIISNQSVTISD